LPRDEKKMSVLKYSLFSLPIYHYSSEKYRKKHDEFVKKRIRELESTGPCPFRKLSEESQRTYRELWYWPPWEFNEIVGYLKVGLDFGSSIVADIYLKRKYLPKSHPSKNRGDRKGTNEILYCVEVPTKISVRTKDNKAYLEAVNNILQQAEKIIRERNKEFRLGLFPFGLENINFIEAIKKVSKQ
jgi:hypothetical protein